MDVLLFLWILFAGVVPPAIVGYIMYEVGRKQGERKYNMAKEEIITMVRDYIKGDLVEDLAVVVKNQVNGILGPMSKEFTEGMEEELPDRIREYNSKYPGILPALINLGKSWAINKMGKKLRVPKDVLMWVNTMSKAGAPMDQLGFPPMQVGKRAQQDDINKYRVE